MNETYLRYLEAKVKELQAQIKVVTDTVYYKDAVIRTQKALLIDFEVKLREALCSSSTPSDSNPS